MESKEKRKVIWRSVSLGDGLPKVIVSVMGKTAEEFAASAERALEAGAQILELRIDSMSKTVDAENAIEACSAVRRVCGDTPILFTMRTQRDGGAGSADREAYEALLCGVIKSGLCDAVDVELSVGEEVFSRLSDFAHEHGMSVVGSSHEFSAIGSVQRVGDWLLAQEALGADICKAAVMPQSREEAFELMFCMVRTGERLGVPYAAIVMGELGVVSRVCAGAMGSCMTFGASGEASAPGQIQAGALRGMLALLGGKA